MSKSIFLLLAVVSFPTVLASQSMSGLKIGDPSSALDKLNLKPVAQASQGSTETSKYKLPNGDDLSVTFDSRSGKIVYLEHDWNGDTKDAASDFPRFTFGVTTLGDIRKALHSNGFAYQSHGLGDSQGGIFFTFNSYNVKDKNGLVVTFVTAFDVGEARKQAGYHDPSKEEIPKILRLGALILAEGSYLDEIWGREKAYDKESRPITWSQTQSNSN